MYLKDEKQPGESRAKLLKDGKTPKREMKGKRERDRGGKRACGKGAKESLKHFCLIKFQDEYQNIQNTIRCQIAKWKIQDTDTDARYRYRANRYGCGYRRKNTERT